MFTGIIEATGKVIDSRSEGKNIHFRIEAPFVDEIKVDQSIAHDGVCLTVIEKDSTSYVVTAIDETLQRTSLSLWKPDRIVNLERCMKVGDRLDGHIVQGHVDTCGTCTEIREVDGSWEFRFEHPDGPGFITVSKGSICINGVSLTVVQSRAGFFSVAIIPYTYEHTNFSQLRIGEPVNLEFDIIGKYVERLMGGGRN
jgi:riboflavin synthase